MWPIRNHRIRAVNPNTGDVRTLCGNGQLGHKDGPGSSAQFNYPVAVAVDADGTLFVADRGNHRVRKVTPKGTVSTLAGSGVMDIQDGKGQQAGLCFPNAIALDSTGRGPIYVADTFSFRIRKIQRDGQVRTICVGPAPPPRPPKPEPPPAAPAPAAAPASAAAPEPAKEAAPAASKDGHRPPRRRRQRAKGAQATRRPPAAEGTKPDGRDGWETPSEAPSAGASEAVEV